MSQRDYKSSASGRIARVIQITLLSAGIELVCKAVNLLERNPASATFLVYPPNSCSTNLSLFMISRPLRNATQKVSSIALGSNRSNDGHETRDPGVALFPREVSKVRSDFAIVILISELTQKFSFYLYYGLYRISS